MRRVQMQSQDKRAKMAAFLAARKAYQRQPDARKAKAMNDARRQVTAMWDQRWWM